MNKKNDMFYINMLYLISIVFTYFYNVNYMPYLTSLYSILLCILMFVLTKNNNYLKKLLLCNIGFGIWAILYLWISICKPYLVNLNDSSFMLFIMPVLLFLINIIIFSIDNEFSSNTLRNVFNVFINNVIFFVLFISIFTVENKFEILLSNLYPYIFFFSFSSLLSILLSYFYKRKNKIIKNIYKSALIFALFIYIVASLFYYKKLSYGVSYYNIDLILYALFPFVINFAIRNIIYKKEIKKNILFKNNYSLYDSYFFSNAVFFLFILAFSSWMFINEFIMISAYYLLLGLSTFNFTLNLIFSHSYFYYKMAKKEREENLKLELYVLDQINDLKNKNTILKKKIINDSITGLYNLNSLYQKLDKLIEKKIDTFSVISINIDDFKSINNVYGHEVGDKILFKVAKRLTNELSNDEIFIYKVDIDEFAILFMDSSYESINEISSTISKIMSYSMNVDNKDIHVAYSTSVVRYPIDASNSTEIVQRLSITMNESKKLKNNKETLFFSDSFVDSIEKRNKFENYFRNLIIDRDFSIQINPYYDIKKEKVTIIRPELKFMNDSFADYKYYIYNYSENIGVLDKLINWYLDKVFNKIAIKINNDEDIDLISIRIYNTPRSMVNFLPIIQKKAETFSYPISSLSFEISSEFLDELYNNHSSVFDTINSLGISLIIRGFGTGYSSLYNFKKCRVKQIVLDSSLITNIDIDEDEQVVFDAIIKIAKGLKIKIIVEGLERISQFLVVKDLECDFAAGSYISNPIDISNFLNEKEIFNI